MTTGNPARRARAGAMKDLFGKYSARKRLNQMPTEEQVVGAMAELRQNKQYLLLRDDGWCRLFEMFIQFCETEAVSEQARGEILLMQSKASTLYAELHRPEEILTQHQEQARKEREHGGKEKD